MAKNKKKTVKTAIPKAPKIVLTPAELKEKAKIEKMLNKHVAANDAYYQAEKARDAAEDLMYDLDEKIEEAVNDLGDVISTRVVKELEAKVKKMPKLNAAGEQLDHFVDNVGNDVEIKLNVPKEYDGDYRAIWLNVPGIVTDVGPMALTKEQQKEVNAAYDTLAKYDR